MRNNVICILFFLLLTNSHYSFAQGPAQDFDNRVLLDLQNCRTPAQTDIGLFLSKNYRYGDIGIPVGMFVGGVIYHNQALRQNSLFVGSSTAFSYGITYLIKKLVKRHRPFIKNVNLVPVYRAGDYSFPSGHTSSTFATATALSMAYPKWYIIAPVFLWAGATSYSRMYLGEHYPTDVAGGAAIGVGSALSMSFLRK